MTNNHILRQLRDTLSLTDEMLLQIFSLSDFSLSKSQLKAVLKQEDAPGALKCKDKMMIAFLDGLIQFKRHQPSSSTVPAQSSQSVYKTLSNNSILKKLRIAFKFHDAHMLEVFQAANREVSKAELNGWFRKEGNKNYKPCSDSVLESFLTGLEKYLQ